MPIAKRSSDATFQEVLKLIEKFNANWNNIVASFGNYTGKDISGIHALYIWQFVRANPQYKKDFVRMIQRVDRDSEVDSLIASNWLLYETLLKPDELTPDQLNFINPRVQLMSWSPDTKRRSLSLGQKLRNERARLAAQTVLGETHLSGGPKPIELIVPPFMTPKLALKQIKLILEDAHRAMDVEKYTLKGRGKGNSLLVNMLCYYGLELKIDAKVIVEKCNDLLDARITSSRVHRNRIAFNETASKAPLCFILPAKK